MYVRYRRQVPAVSLECPHRRSRIEEPACAGPADPLIGSQILIARALLANCCGLLLTNPIHIVNGLHKFRVSTVLSRASHLADELLLLIRAQRIDTLNHLAEQVACVIAGILFAA